MVPTSLRLLLWLSSTAGGGQRGWASGQLGCLAALDSGPGLWPWAVEVASAVPGGHSLKY